jgi:hypothetical protein
VLNEVNPESQFCSQEEWNACISFICPLYNNREIHLAFFLEPKYLIFGNEVTSTINKPFMECKFQHE